MNRTLRIPLEVGVDAGRSLESRPVCILDYDTQERRIQHPIRLKAPRSDRVLHMTAVQFLTLMDLDGLCDEKLLDLLDYLAAQEAEKDREAEAVYGKVGTDE